MKNFLKALSAQAKAAIYPLAFPGRSERNWDILRIFKANNGGVHIHFYGDGGSHPFERRGRERSGIGGPSCSRDSAHAGGFPISSRHTPRL